MFDNIENNKDVDHKSSQLKSFFLELEKNNTASDFLSLVKDKLDIKQIQDVAFVYLEASLNKSSIFTLKSIVDLLDLLKKYKIF